jgi:hypothetical protein
MSLLARSDEELAAVLSGHDSHAFKLPVHRDYMRFQPLHGETPVLSDAERQQVAAWVQTDAAHLERVRQEHRGRSVVQPPTEDWFGGFTAHAPRQPLVIKPAGLGLEGVKANVKLAEEEESLVAIRLDCDVDTIKLKDTFTWNARGSSVPALRHGD